MREIDNTIATRCTKRSSIRQNYTGLRNVIQNPAATLIDTIKFENDNNFEYSNERHRPATPIQKKHKQSIIQNKLHRNKNRDTKPYYSIDQVPATPMAMPSKTEWKHNAKMSRSASPRLVDFNAAAFVSATATIEKAHQ